MHIHFDLHLCVYKLYPHTVYISYGSTSSTSIPFPHINLRPAAAPWPPTPWSQGGKRKLSRSKRSGRGWMRSTAAWIFGDHRFFFPLRFLGKPHLVMILRKKRPKTSKDDTLSTVCWRDNMPRWPRGVPERCSLLTGTKGDDPLN